MSVSSSPLTAAQSDAATPGVVELSDLQFGYQAHQPVVQRFTASLRAGRLCALIGPNAVGKTTLLRLILGQLPPWSGSLTVCGKSVGTLSSRQRAAMLSYVPQHGLVSFAYTAEQVVDMGRYAQAADKQAVEHAIDMCDLLHVRARVYAELSAGQQQRVLLARAIAQSAGGGAAMLLDEPVSSMDLRHMHHTMRTLVRLARQGLAVLAVLHDLNLAARYADDVWLMHEGTLAASGVWSDVLKPQILEPVYGIAVRAMTVPAADRPLFYVENGDTIMADETPLDEV